MYSLNVGVQKSSVDEWLTAKLSGIDLLWRRNARGRNTLRDYDEDFIVQLNAATGLTSIFKLTREGF